VYLGREAQLLEQGRNPLPAVDADSWVYADREFTVRVEQPSDPRTPIPMQVLTKGPGLLDGFRVRPTVQSADNPWEMPLFYTDERSVFFVTGDEQQYHERLRWYVGDAVLGRQAVKVVPKAFEEAVKPVIPKRGDPVIDPAFAFRLPGNAAFSYRGTTFDAGGVTKERIFGAGPAGPANG
jgi:hypothetical protein